MTALTPHRAGMLLAIVAAFGFSFKAIFIKLAYPYGVDAITLLALRMAFALPIFLWVGFRASRSAPPLSGRDWLVVLFLGSVGYYGASILDFLGLRYISAGLERLILFTYPTITLLLGLLMYQQRITRRQVGATLLCSAGLGRFQRRFLGGLGTLPLRRTHAHRHRRQVEVLPHHGQR